MVVVRCFKTVKLNHGKEPPDGTENDLTPDHPSTNRHDPESRKETEKKRFLVCRQDESACPQESCMNARERDKREHREVCSAAFHLPLSKPSEFRARSQIGLTSTTITMGHTSSIGWSTSPISKFSVVCSIALNGKPPSGETTALLQAK